MSSLAHLDPRMDSQPMMLVRSDRQRAVFMLRPEPAAPSYEVVVDEEADDIELPRASRTRQLAARVAGGIVVGAALLGLAQIAMKPEARKAILDWGTVGHGAQLEKAVSKTGGMFAHGFDPFAR